MGKSSRVQHEGIVKSISTQTLEVSIISHSACSGCHAKSACGIALYYAVHIDYRHHLFFREIRK